MDGGIERKVPTEEKEEVQDGGFDGLVEQLGEFGPFQRWLYAFLCLPSAAMAIGVYASVFLEFVPNHRCQLPLDCFDGQIVVGPDAFEYSPPLFVDSLKDPICTLPQSLLNGSRQCNSITIDDALDDAVGDCRHHVFDTSLFPKTVVTDFHAVCDRSYLNTVSSTVYMSGMLFGSLLFGWFSDAFGRRLCFALCVLFLALGSSLAALSTDYAMYMVFRFITSMGGVGCFITAFVLSTEFVGKRYRTICGIMIEVPFAIGELYVTILAYFVRDWRTLQLCIGVPFFLLLLYLVKLPESVRWALAVGKTELASKTVKRMADFNKVVLPQGQVLNVGATKANEIGVVSLLTSKPLRPRLAVMSLNWVVTTLCYYGLSLNAGLGDDVFTTFSISAAMEIPSYIFCVLVVDYWGRKPILSFCQILSAVSCIAAGLVVDPTIRTVLSMIGKFGSSAAFGVVFLYTAELFPTAMRNSALGVCSTLARLGGILAPSVSNLGYVRPQLPYLIFGGATLIGGAAALLLPETMGRRLPDSVQEALDMTIVSVNTNEEIFLSDQDLEEEKCMTEKPAKT